MNCNGRSVNSKNYNGMNPINPMYNVKCQLRLWIKQTWSRRKLTVRSSPPRPISPINATSFGMGNSKKLKTRRKEAWMNSEKIDQNRSPTCFYAEKE